MDYYSLPVAKRTRSRVGEVVYKEFVRRKKKIKKEDMVLGFVTEPRRLRSGMVIIESVTRKRVSPTVAVGDNVNGKKEEVEEDKGVMGIVVDGVCGKVEDKGSVEERVFKPTCLRSGDVCGKEEEKVSVVVVDDVCSKEKEEKGSVEKWVFERMRLRSGTVCGKEEEKGSVDIVVDDDDVCGKEKEKESVEKRIFEPTRLRSGRIILSVYDNQTRISETVLENGVDSKCEADVDDMKGELGNEKVSYNMKKGNCDGGVQFNRKGDDVAHEVNKSAGSDWDWVEYREDETVLEETIPDENICKNYMAMPSSSVKNNIHVAVKIEKDIGLDFWVASNDNIYGQVDVKPKIKRVDLEWVADVEQGDGRLFAREMESNTEEFVKHTTRFRKTAPKTHEVLKFLADALLDRKEMPLNDWVSEPETKLIPINDVILPLKHKSLKPDFVILLNWQEDSIDRELTIHNGFNPGKNPCGKSEYRSRNREQKPLLDKFENQDSGFLSKCDSDVDDSQKTAWDLVPGVKQSMYHHQREGFEFIWKNVAGGIFVNKLKNGSTNNGGSGCIISHAPGTGKTRLTIVFLQSYMEKFPDCKPVIVAPRSMLLTWEEEFKKWEVGFPFHILNINELSGKERVAAIDLSNQSKDRRVVRLIKLLSWKKYPSVLGISYDLFKLLAGEKDKTETKDYQYDEQVKELLLDTPELFIFDEGHTPRNEQSHIFKSLFNIKTEKRIILSGTPFQNNFDELYNTLCLVRPSFADKISSENRAYMSKNRGRKTTEAKDKWASLTGSIGKDSSHRRESERIEELRAMIAPFVHIHKGNILQQTLLGLRHSVVVLQPDAMQKSLLDLVHGTKNPVMLDYYVSLVSVHPSLLHASFDNAPCVNRRKLEKLRLSPEFGVKTRFLMELLRLTEAVGEKVLVFGQFIEELSCIKDQLESQRNWREGKEVLYMDGQSSSKKRQSFINDFNNPGSAAKIMLASIKACGEGINLIGASRVVLLDVVWNPSVERQAISRAYRIGQKKVVYVYRLITSGTVEEEKCCRQAEKDRLSELVFCSPGEGGNNNASTMWEDDILQEMNRHERLKNMFRKIIYEQPKESDFSENVVEDGSIFERECYF
ncbi:hypothetical protein ACFE04_014215 [Oxalis oulophora]